MLNEERVGRPGEILRVKSASETKFVFCKLVCRLQKQFFKLALPVRRIRTQIRKVRSVLRIRLDSSMRAWIDTAIQGSNSPCSELPRQFAQRSPARVTENQVEWLQPVVGDVIDRAVLSQ